MLAYSVMFLVAAMIAAVLGFGMAAAAFAGLAKVVFYVFLIAFVITLLMHFNRRSV